MVNKALASKFCGDVSNRAEICGKDAGSYISVLPNCMGCRLSLQCMILHSHLVETCEEAGQISAPQIKVSWTVSS